MEESEAQNTEETQEEEVTEVETGADEVEAEAETGEKADAVGDIEAEPAEPTADEDAGEAEGEAEAEPEAAAEETGEGEAAEETGEGEASEETVEGEAAEETGEGEAAEEVEMQAEGEADADAEAEPPTETEAAAEPYPEVPEEFADEFTDSDIPPEDRAEFCEAWRLISDERGHIEGREVRKFVQTLGQDCACQEAVLQQMEEQGLDDDCQLSFSEVNKLVSGAYRPRKQVQDDLMHSFRVFDKNGNGYLEYDELYRALFHIGNQALEESARDDFDQLIRLVDKNQDGKIDYSEFCQMVTMGVADLRRRIDEE